MDYFVIFSILLVIFTCSFISTITYWINFNGLFNEEYLIIYEGKLMKKVKYIPIVNIIGFHEKYNWIEKKLKLSSIFIKINTSDEDESVNFPYISNEGSLKIKNNLKINTTNKKTIKSCSESEAYYTTSKKMLLKAALSTFHIVLFIIFSLSMYSYLNDYISLSSFLNDLSRWFFKGAFNITLGSLILFIFSYFYGYIRMYLKYKNFYLINRDTKLIIKSGVLSTNEFSILKSSISGIIIEANFLQKIIGLEKIKIISTNPKKNKTEEDVIIPFSERNEYQIHLFNIFNFQISEFNFNRIPKVALIVKFLRVFIPCVFLFILGFYYIPLFLFIFIFFIALVYLSQLIQTVFSKYSYTNEMLIIEKSGLVYSEYITTYKNIEELLLTQSLIQRAFNLASITIINKSVPPKKIRLRDIPFEKAIVIKNKFLHQHK